MQTPRHAAPLALRRRLQSNLRRSRTVLYGLTLPLLAFSLAGAADSFLRLAYIILGFSLIIFLHEAGHFVVARLCSVKCLAFSLGIGPRVCGYRKGAGLSWGADPYDPDTLAEKRKSAPAGKTLGEIADDKVALKPVDHDASPIEKAELATTHSDLPTTAEIPPHPASVGDCDYRLSWLPLGGYVRMLGQDDMDPTKVSTDPHAFNQRPIWQRMCIVSAGVIMNLIFAAVTFSIIFSPGIGVAFPPAVIGQVQYDSPAWKAGLQMGDEVLTIDGHKPRGFLEFTDIQMAAALSTGSDPITLRVRPRGTTGNADKNVSITPTKSDITGFLAFGVEPLIGLKIGGAASDYTTDREKEADAFMLYEKNKDGLSKIRKGDEIVAIDNVDVKGDYLSLYQRVQAANGAPVKLTLANRKSTLPLQDILLYPHVEPIPGFAEYPPVLGMGSRLIIGAPDSGTPAAKAGLKDGDVIVRIGDRTNPTAKQMVTIVGASAGQELPLEIERNAKRETLKIAPREIGGKYRIGVPLVQKFDNLTFLPAAPDNEVAALHLPSTASITAVDGQKVGTWNEIYSVLRTKSPGSSVPVTFLVDGKEVTHPLPFSQADHDLVTTRMHYQLVLRLENLTRTQVAENAWDATMMGAEHTKKFILQVYQTLYGLFNRTVDPSNLHGIVGITKVGYDVQERGPVWLWYVLAMVSVNLAVANFLPLPIVDGGLFLLLILEKIRGKPLPLKVQSAIQVVGIVLLGGLFLFVTWNDLHLFTK